MIHNYFLIAMRNLLRQKRYAFINLFGLAIGLSCCVIALVIIHHEYSYDRFHPQADRIYRVLRERSSNDDTQVRWLTDGALARALEAEIPEVAHATKNRIYPVVVRHKDHALELEQGQIDENFFAVFNFPFVTGNADLLKQPYHIAITQEAAKRLFGQVDPVGQTVTLQERYYGGDYTIVAILKNPPVPSSIQFDLLHMTNGRTEEANLDWNGWQSRVQQAGIETFVLFREGVDTQILETKISGIIERHMGLDVRKNLSYRLQPLLRLHLYGLRDYNLSSSGSIDTLYLFAGIALLVLIIASINFVNLSTARSAGRAREVGLRKVIGANRGQLIGQFLGESIFLALLSLLFAIALAQLALPYLNSLTGIAVVLDTDVLITLLPILFAFTLIVGLIAGFYPALYLSAFQPAFVLTGTLGSSNSHFRQVLVITQFALAILLMVGTDVVYRQLTFIQTKNLGFDREHVVLLPMFAMDRESKTNNDAWLVGRYNLVKQTFLENPGVGAASAFRFLPGRDGGGFVRIVKPEGHDNIEWRMPVQEIDESFFETLGVPLLSGRTFSPDIEHDRTHAYILNKTAVEALGWTVENAVGRRFGRDRSEDDANGTVIGVVDDFHYASLRDHIEPAAFTYRQWFFNYLALRVRDFSNTRPFLEQTWAKWMAPNQPFTFGFLDDEIDAIYRSERQQAKIVTLFAGLAILLACLGLFGLAAFTAERRMREIGIRKVLGASSMSIVVLLSQDFVKYVALANFIAWPIAYYLADQWLQNFAYHISLGFGSFLLAGLLAFFIALITVSLQSLKAAHTNPVDTLRHE